MAAKENNLSTIVSLIQVVKLLRGSSSTGESYLFSTKLYYWEDQSFECPKTQLDYLGARVLCIDLQTLQIVINKLSHTR